ncbi:MULTISPECIES: recombinase family protein [unclassified Crossiella]|uniref:recombinase family protein n=1 Tax=unclassified Crossiella TaxID=2620835 RepID=UPI001FFE821C|nr:MULTISPECIES: recombinase family protein [unclassified Crossiella]MCK2241848.1 recombinase family protein [Crossiella sp. S99.2]MCK2255751.1 recombinase family protein [Crossiella sp. S99.1]
MNGTSKITTEHRARSAVVYVRQSTLMQVREHGESTARQYGLSSVAVELGWTAEQVIVVDADLGVSGRFGSERDGFRELISRVCLGEVGAIFGLEVSRLARSSAEFARLLELARLTDTLLIDGDGVYDLGDVNDRLLLGLKGSMSEAELHLLAGRLHGAKLAAAHRGELRAPLPVGFVYDLDNQVVIDPDEQVRTAVEDLFSEFARTGSAYGVVKAFADTGRLFPQRAWGGVWSGRLKWGKLGHYRVLQALKNPVYAGAYAYGRTYDKRRVQPDGTVRSSRRNRAREEWTVLIPEHHEGYLSWQQFLDNEAKLAANHTARGARPPREGTALCQGIIYCGACGARMGSRYGKRHYVFYVCAAERDQATTVDCRSVAVSTVDEVVGRLLLDAVTPEQITSALVVADEVTQRHVRSHRAAELAVERARYEADRAERAFSQVEPENRLVARSLESRWETKLAALAEAEAALETARAAKPPLPPRSRLEALAADLPRLWDDPDTSPRDRKRLLRTLIADVTLLPTDHEGQVRIGVRWHTGATDEITANRKGPGRTPATALEIIRRYGAVKTSQQLADQLHAAGLTTGKGRPFDAAAVARIRDTYGIPGPRTAAVQDGEVSVTQAAELLGVTNKAIYYWIRHDLVPVRRVEASRRWCIPWDDHSQAIYRQQAAKPTSRGKRTTPTTAGGAV